MKAQLICNGQTIEVEVSEEQVKKLFSEKKKTGYERAEAHAGIKDSQLSSYVLKDESQEEMDWMRDYPRSIPSQEVCRATIGLILGGHEIRLYRIVGPSVIVPVNTDYLAPLEGTEYFVRSMEGKPVLAVKNGMFIEAVITPYDAFGEKDGVPLPGLKAAMVEATEIWR